MPSKQEEGFMQLIMLNIKKLGGWYIHIPDAIPGKDKLIKKKSGKGNTMQEHPRPNDGTIYFPESTVSVELKAGSNKLEPHQYQTGKLLESMSDTRLVWCTLRMKLLKNKEVFSVESAEREVYYETNDVTDMLKWLREKNK